MTERSEQSRRPRRARVALLSALLFFAGTELVLRLVDYRFPAFRLPVEIWNPEEDRFLRQGDGLFVVSASQLWVPRPGAELPWESAAGETVNAAGYRGPLRPPERTPGRLRIAALGDSSTFGFGVAFADTWCARLEQRLRDAGRDVEVLDFGVIGFTSAQGIARYREVVRAYRPDVVLAAFGAVNESVPTTPVPDREKLAELTEPSAWQRAREALRDRVRVLHLAGRVAERLRGIDRTEALTNVRLAQRDRRERNKQDIGALDFPGIRRVTVARFGEDLVTLLDDVRADGARPALIQLPRDPAREAEWPVLPLYSEESARVASSEQVPLVDYRARVHAALARGDYAWESRLLDAYHPRPAAHAELAEQIAVELEDLWRP